MAQWNGRDVFKSGSYRFERQESDYDRSRLASVLRDWSLGTQEDLTEQINRWDRPILWIVGEDDAAYVKQIKRLDLNHLLSNICVVPMAGHRVPWEQPQVFLKTLTSFIAQVEHLHHDQHLSHTMGNH